MHHCRLSFMVVRQWDACGFIIMADSLMAGEMKKYSKRGNKDLEIIFRINLDDAAGASDGGKNGRTEKRLL